MEAETHRLNKRREERIAKEKARIEKLRELNLKKYTKEEPFKHSMQPANQPTTSKPVKTVVNLKTNNTGAVKNNFHVNGTTKRPINLPALKPLNKTKAKTDGKSLNSNIPIASSSNVSTKLDTPANATSMNIGSTATTDKEVVQNNGNKVTHVMFDLAQTEGDVNE